MAETRIVLTLTSSEADILGFALGIAMRDQKRKRDAAIPGGDLESGCMER